MSILDLHYDQIKSQIFKHLTIQSIKNITFDRRKEGIGITINASTITENPFTIQDIKIKSTGEVYLKDELVGKVTEVDMIQYFDREGQHLIFKFQPVEPTISFELTQ